jgi:hypothetical protein
MPRLTSANDSRVRFLWRLWVGYDRGRRLPGNVGARQYERVSGYTPRAFAAIENPTQQQRSPHPLMRPPLAIEHRFRRTHSPIVLMATHLPSHILALLVREVWRSLGCGFSGLVFKRASMTEGCSRPCPINSRIAMICRTWCHKKAEPAKSRTYKSPKWTVPSRIVSPFRRTEISALSILLPYL